jgi:hypothetical protein
MGFGFILRLLVLILAVGISAGIRCPQGCEICDSELGCLKIKDLVNSNLDRSRTLQVSDQLCVDCEHVSKTCKKNAHLNEYHECVCNINYFKTTAQCSPCNPLCKSCDPDLGCISCKDNAGHDPTDCRCNSGYGINGLICRQCAENLCDTCTFKEGQEDGCLTPKKNVSCTGTSCSCKAGFYEIYGSCITCSTKYCKFCDDSDKCLTCSDDTRATPTCECKSGYYDNDYDACTACTDLLCDSCPLDICKTCKENAQLDALESKCKCSEGFYPSNIGDKCLPCSSDPLMTCDSASGNLRCKNGAEVKEGDTSCSCLNGYYLDGYSCTKCPELCETCADNEGCTACKANAGNRIDECDCSPGHYKSLRNDIATCEECPQDLCEECHSELAQDCYKCVDDASWDYDTKSCKCDEGFRASDDGNFCIECPHLCKSCNESACTECMPSAGEDVTDCDCEQGFYFDKQFRKCVICPDLCQVCGDLGCQTPVENAICTDKQVVCECKKGYYYDGSRCVPCSDILCLACTSQDTCYEWKPFTIDSNGSRVCDEGFYLNYDDCEKCPDDLCSECQGNACLKCVEHADIYRGDCSCNYDYYALDGKCVRCDPLCANCTPTGCYECKENACDLDDCKCLPGYYESNGQCTPCDDELCNVCDETQSICSECIKHAQVAQGETDCSCDLGFYQAGRRCLECPYLAESCAGPETAIVCKEFTKVDITPCECEDGYFEWENKCIPCEDNLCKVCDGGVCSQCNNNAEKDLNGICQCKLGYHDKDESGSCEECDSLCRECDPEEGCAKCKLNATLENDDCSCDNGYWEFQGQCIAFDPLCDEFGLEGCTSCTEHAGDDPTNCVCERGYYENRSICSACEKLCASCTGIGQCDTCVEYATGGGVYPCECPNNYKVVNNSCVECPSGMVRNPKQEDECVCPANKYLSGADTCSDCPDLTEKEVGNSDCACVSGGVTRDPSLDPNTTPCRCPDLQYFKDDICIDIPAGCKRSTKNHAVLEAKDTYFKDPNSDTCIPCGALCKTCVDSTNCLSCIDDDSMALENGACSCDAGFYEEENTCKACKGLCGTCSASDICETCKQGSNNLENVAICECNTGLNINTPGDGCINPSCPNLCTTCDEDPDICSVCTTNATADNEGVCLCNPEHYESGTSCLRCQNLCSECDDGNSCRACKAYASKNLNGTCECYPTFLTIINSSGNLCKCADTHRLVASDHEETNPTCAECGPRMRHNPDDITECICKDPNTVSTTNCTCITGYFYASDILGCVEIPEHCELDTAIPGDDATLKGKLGYFILGGRCLKCDNYPCNNSNSGICITCKCSAGTYESSPGVCTPCNPLCKFCDPEKGCLECKENANGPSNCSCNYGYRFHIDQCVPCPRLCRDCTENGCQACVSNARSDSSSCICAEGYYESHNVCSPCTNYHPICTICNEALCLQCGENSTLTNRKCICNPGYYGDGGKCASCSGLDQLCSNCTKQGCNSCVDNSTRVNERCVCDAGFYMSGNKCLKCDSLCSKCDGSKCIECIPNSTLNTSTGSCVCNKGHEYNDSTFTCNLTANAKYDESDPDKWSCIEGYFKSGDKCLKCHEYCATCDDSGKCLTCYDKYASAEYCECKPGYIQINGSCIISPRSQCLSFDSSDICTKCKAFSGTAPYCRCPKGYFQTGNSCSICSDELCEACNSSDICTKCKPFAGKAPNCGCIVGYQQMGDACIKCPGDLCQICDNLGTCLKCKPFAGQAPNCECEIGYYKTGTTCSRCPGELCQDCNSAGVCTTCKPFAGKAPHCACRGGYYERPVFFSLDQNTFNYQY